VDGAPPARHADVVVWLTFGLGLVTTALGVAYAVAVPTGAHSSVPNQVMAAVIGSLGAGVVGAALSMLIGNLADRGGREDLLRLLSRALGARFTSDEGDLSLLRADWHHYHVTTVGGRYVWRHIRYHLDQWSAATGSLRYQHKVTDGQGHAYAFTAEAGIRGSHLIILINGSRAEIGAQSSEIFPLFLVHGYRTRHCGIGTYRTWDNRNIIGKTIMSRDPLAPADDDGAVPVSHFARLDEVWDADFGSQHDLLPAAEQGLPHTP
jgi:hypothetical protein